MSDTTTPLCFLSQLAPGQSCMGTDRDGEAWIKVLLSRQDLATVVTRMDELREGFYVTLVPESQVRGASRRRQQSAGGC